MRIMPWRWTGRVALGYRPEVAAGWSKGCMDCGCDLFRSGRLSQTGPLEGNTGLEATGPGLYGQEETGPEPWQAGGKAAVVELGWVVTRF